MENINISYRKLRDPKRAKTGKTPSSLLVKKPLHKNIESRQGEDSKSIMTQNVTRYEHILKNPNIKQNDINWIVKLRQPIKLKAKTQSETQYVSIPNVFHKTTESRQNYLKQKETSIRSYNSADFFQVISRKQCVKHLQNNTLGYMASLRSQNQPLHSPEKSKFCNLPFKDRKQFPTFLTKEAIKKLKYIKKQQKQTAFDGSQNYPPYAPKILTEKNYGVLSTFTRQNIMMPILSWQMGLRN